MQSRCLLFILFACVPLLADGQNLTATYVELADSADYYINRKMWAQAEKVIVDALRHEPANKSNFVLWSNLGIVRENLEDYSGAVEAYTIGLSSAPKSTVLLTNRARALLATNDLSGALSDLDTALATDSTLQWPMKMRGIILASLGETRSALDALEKYEKKFGEDSAVSETIGDITAAQGNYDKASEAYKTAYRLGKDEQLLCKILLTGYSYGKLEEWTDYIASGIKDYPRNPMLYLLRALLNKSKYQIDAYESDLKTAKNLGIDKNLYNLLIGK